MTPPTKPAEPDRDLARDIEFVKWYHQNTRSQAKIGFGRLLRRLAAPQAKPSLGLPLPIDEESGLFAKMVLAAGAAMRDPGFSGLTSADVDDCNVTNVVRQVFKAAEREMARGTQRPQARSAPIK